MYLWELLSNIDENRETVGDQIKERNDYIWKNNVKCVANRDFKCKLIAIHQRTKLEEVPHIQLHLQSVSICKNFMVHFSSSWNSQSTWFSRSDCGTQLQYIDRHQKEEKVMAWF